MLAYLPLRTPQSSEPCLKRFALTRTADDVRCSNSRQQTATSVSVQQHVVFIFLGGNCQQHAALLLFIPQTTDGNIVAAEATKTAGVC
jgi:hypothetical protein